MLAARRTVAVQPRHATSTPSTASLTHVATPLHVACTGGERTGSRQRRGAERRSDTARPLLPDPLGLSAAGRAVSSPRRRDLTIVFVSQEAGQTRRSNRRRSSHEPRASGRARRLSSFSPTAARGAETSTGGLWPRPDQKCAQISCMLFTSLAHVDYVQIPATLVLQ